MFVRGLSEDECTLILIAENYPWRSLMYPSKETARFQIHAGG
jgi:hypothetical protein